MYKSIMSNFIHPAPLSDIFGSDGNFSFSQQLYNVNGGRISEPPVASYEQILKNMNLNGAIIDVPKSENEIKDLNETEKLKTDSLNISKKITTTRQKCKEIDGVLKKAKEEFDNLNDIRKNFMKNYNELCSLILLNESSIKDDGIFINKLINETNKMEDKFIGNIKKLEEERDATVALLASLTSFITQSLKAEMTDEELLAIQSGKTCSICIEKDINVAFPACGHTACSSCAENLNRCHLCRREILTKIKLFFS
jgi:hypothetical protein